MYNLEIFSTPWLLAVLAVLIAAFIRGLTGFGLALVLAPILILVLEPTTVIAINLSLAMLSNILVLSYSLKKVNFKGLIPMLIGSAFGIPVGIWIITVIPQQSLKILIGSLTVTGAILLFIGFGKTFTKERLFSGITGFLGGMLSSSTSLGGPPVVLFMHSQKWKKEVIHPSLAAYFSFICILSLIALSVSGIVNLKTVMSSISLFPALLVGTGLGILVFHRIDARYFRWFSVVIIISAGILGILSATGLFL